MSWDDDFLGELPTPSHGWSDWHRDIGEQHLTRIFMLSRCRHARRPSPQKLVVHPGGMGHGLSASDTRVPGSPVAAIAGRIVGIEPGNHFFGMFDALPPIGEEPGAEPAERQQIDALFFV